MSVKVVLAKAHEGQLADAQIRKEYESISEAYKDAPLKYKDGTINFVFVKGIYVHSERQMITACLFVNKMDRAVKEIHGVIRLKFIYNEAKAAKATVDFDEEFIGKLNSDEALLVHLAIPVRGLSDNADFFAGDITGTFEDVRVTYIEE